MKLTAFICALALFGLVPVAGGNGIAFASEGQATAVEAGDHTASAPSNAELEPTGVARGTTVRQARIAQNWLLLGIGAVA